MTGISNDPQNRDSDLNLQLGKEVTATASEAVHRDLAKRLGSEAVACSLESTKALVEFFQIAVARKVQAISDQLLISGAATDHMASPSGLGLRSHEKFEALLRDLRQIANQGAHFAAIVSTLAAAAGQGRNSNDEAATQEQPLMGSHEFDGDALADPINHHNLMQRKLMQAMRPLREALLEPELAHATTLEYRRALNEQNRFLSGIVALSERIDFESDILDYRVLHGEVLRRDRTSNFDSVATRLETSGQVASSTIDRLAALCRIFQREPGDPEIGLKGVIITPQTREVFLRHLDAGAKLVTLQKANHEVGLALYYEPGNIPSNVQSSLHHYKQFGSAAFVHLILVDPSMAGTPAHQMLLNAVLVHLQRTSAEIAVGRVEATNNIARRAHYTNGWREMPGDVLEITSPQGKTARFTGHYLPVSPQWRETLSAPEIRASFTDWPIVGRQLFNEIGSLDQQPAALQGAEKLRSEALTDTQLIEKLGQAQHLAVVRFTGGCGDMKRHDWLGAVNLFAEAFDGFEGAMLAGATQMIAKFDDGLSTNIRGSICELPLAIRAVNSGSLVGGICIGERTATQYGKHVVLSGSIESSENHVTVKHTGFQDYVTVDEERLGQKSRWDAEYVKALALIDGLVAKDFQPCLISFNGGGTTRREVEAWAERGLPVVLIRGSGRETDVMANDRAFLESNASVYVVERDAQQLRQALQQIGVLPEPSRSFSEVY